MPPPRRRMRHRRSHNEKRRLMQEPSPDLIQRMLDNAWYEGSSKHKRHPHLFNLEPFNGDRDDATLCDVAAFRPEDMRLIPSLLRRGIRAGLIGHTGRTLWTVSDDGWIFEARETNRDSDQYHGYPVLPEETIARIVYDRFADWCRDQGTVGDRTARDSCRLRYGFR